MAGQRKHSADELFFWVALAMAPGIGPYRFLKLIEAFGSPEAVMTAGVRELAGVPEIGKTIAQGLKRFAWRSKVEDELRRSRELGTEWLTLADSAYPARLKEIADPPPVLWVRGSLRDEDRAAVALVGSRRPDRWGRETTRRLAAELSELEITVVSGMAMGIDAEAHRGAIAAGGRTIGVLGCGLDRGYPAANRDLYKRIPEDGVLMSEFPLGTDPRPGNFPQRNRIISGLSLAVVIVQAKAKSGALITARLALEQNRDVMAVPGRLESDLSRGPHELLKQGARLVETGQDVLNEIAPQLERRPKGRAGRAPGGAETGAAPTSEEKTVLEAMSENIVHVDVIGRALAWSPQQLAAVLLEMELKGLIRQLPGMNYKRS